MYNSFNLNVILHCNLQTKVNEKIALESHSGDGKFLFEVMIWYWSMDVKWRSYKNDAITVMLLKF
jgi:hypothetical protein